MMNNHDIELKPCGECDMLTKPGEYHPYAACLMFKSCQNSDTVRANIDAVMLHGHEHISTNTYNPDTHMTIPLYTLSLLKEVVPRWEKVFASKSLYQFSPNIEGTARKSYAACKSACEVSGYDSMLKASEQEQGE